MAVVSALALASGVVVPGTAKAVIRLMAFLCIVALCIGLSAVMSRHRRLQFLVKRQFESDVARLVEVSREADSILNHTLKNTMADAAGEIEMFLESDHLRRSVACLQRGMRSCRHRQAYIQLAAERYQLSCQAVHLQAFVDEHSLGLAMQRSVADLTVWLDPTLCGLLLGNTINNAFKHGHPQRPDVHLRTEIGLPSGPTPPADTRHQRGRVAFVIWNRCHAARPKIDQSFLAAVLSGQRAAGAAGSPMSDRIGLQQSFAAARAHHIEVSLVQTGDIVTFRAEMEVDVVPPEASPQQSVPAASVPPDLHICCIDDSPSMRRLLESGLGPRMGTSNVHVFGKDEDEVPEFMAKVLQDGDIAILDQHLECGSDANILGTDLVGQLLKKGFRGLICMRSGNNASEDLDNYLAAGAHCAFRKDQPLSQVAEAMKREYLRCIGANPVRLVMFEPYEAMRLQAAGQARHGQLASRLRENSSRAGGEARRGHFGRHCCVGHWGCVGFRARGSWGMVSAWAPSPTRRRRASLTHRSS